MSDNSSSDWNVLVGLQSVIGTECPQCGEINPSSAYECEQCGEPLPIEEEEEVEFSYVHQEGVEVETVSAEKDPLYKIPVDQAKNLQVLKEILEKAKNAEITLEEYREGITKVMNVAKMGVELFKSDVVRNKIASLPAEEQVLANSTANQFEKFYAGCKRMLEYDGGGDGTAAVEGYYMVEKAIKKMDEIQDKAIAIAKGRRKEKEDDTETHD